MTQPSLASVGPIRTDVLDRLLSKCRVDEITGCWPWTGHIRRPEGYGMLRLGNWSWPAHRAAYEIFNGPIPAGLQVDHVCHNRDTSCRGGPGDPHRRCVNPGHLEAVTGALNTLRSVNTIGGINTRKDKCKRGHPLDEVNTYWIPNKYGRQCRACKADLSRESAARVRARASALKVDTP